MVYGAPLLKGNTLRKITQQFVNLILLLGHPTTADEDFTLKITDQADQYFHGGRFSRTVRSDVSKDFSFLNLEGHSVQSAEAVEIL